MPQRNALFPLKPNSRLSFLSVYVAKHVLDSVIPVLIGLIPMSDTGYYKNCVSKHGVHRTHDRVLFRARRAHVKILRIEHEKRQDIFSN